MAKMKNGPDTEDLKIRGNTFFQQKQYSSAIQCYTAALEQMTAENNVLSTILPSSDYQKAVFYSNRSNCHFELGDYVASISDARQCLEILERGNEELQNIDDDDMRGKITTLQHKNQWRIVRAMYYVEPSQSDPKLNSLLEILVRCGDPVYAKAARQLQTQLHWSSSGLKEEISIDDNLRASCNDPVCEYFSFAHDIAMSLLGAGIGEVERRTSMQSKKRLPSAIRLADLPHPVPQDDSPSPRRSLAFMFAGVGDARNVFATLMDSYDQNKQFSDKSDRFQFHITLNDIKEAVLARDVLLLILLHRLGCFDSHNQVASNPEAGLWATMLHYLYLGYVLPPNVHSALQQLLRELLSFEDSKAFTVKFPWMTVVDNGNCGEKNEGWEQMRAIWSYWLNEGTNDFKFPSLPEAMFQRFKPKFSKSETPLDEFKSQNPEAAKRMEERMQKAQATRRANLADSARDVNNWDPKSLAVIRSRVGRDASREEMVQCALSLIEDLDVDVLTKDHLCVGPGLKVDELFLAAIHALIPPHPRENANPCHGSFVEMHNLLWSVIVGDADPDSIEDAPTMMSVAKAITTTWRSVPSQLNCFV